MVCMKRLILILIIGSGGLYIHSRVVFSESSIMQWIAEYNNKALSGDSTVCDDFSNDLEVNIIAKSVQGHWEVKGGKAEMCGYLNQASAAFTVLQASHNTQFEGLKIERGGFPWTTVHVKYHQKSVMQADHIPTMSTEGDEALTLVKGFSGIKIKALESRSTTTISH